MTRVNARSGVTAGLQLGLITAGARAAAELRQLGEGQ